MRAIGWAPFSASSDAITSAAAPSVMPGALPAVTVPPSGWKAGRSLASASSVESARGPSSAEMTVSPFLPGHRDRDDLVVEATRFLGGDRPLMRAQRELVLRLTRHVVLRRHALGVQAHVDVAGRAPQTVVDRRVDQRPVAEPVAGARLRQQVWREVHVLHAPRHHEVGVAGANGRCAQHHRLEPGAAHLVDGGRAHAFRQPRLERRLPSRRLAGPGLQNLADDRLVDALRGDAGALDGGADGDGAELGGGGGREAAAELADRGAGGGEDVYVTHAPMVLRPVIVGRCWGSRTRWCSRPSKCLTPAGPARAPCESRTDRVPSTAMTVTWIQSWAV